MANFEIDEDQAALIRELRKLETSDPVHANVYNALFEKLINNDAFLERLANKMVEKSMLCHVLDSVNAQQVLAADVGPKITAITNELKENVSVLNTNLNIWKIKEPVQGTCNLNTTAWIETGSSVEWIVVNGLCFVHYVLIVKTDSAYDAELATGLPTPKFFIHECVNEWDMSSSKKCQLMVSGKRMTGTVKAGTYAGTICYAVA